MHDCFVVMPIGIGDAYQVHLNRYEHIIHPAVEGLKDGEQHLFRCIRADFVAKSGSITKDSRARHQRADVLAPNTEALGAQQIAQHAGAGKRVLKV